MAVAHSAASESHTGSTGSTNQAAFSWTHTQTGTPQGVVVFVSTFNSVSDFITSVTYGGVALTRLSGGSAQDAAGELGRMDAFFLGSGLGTGNQTITVNRTNNATVMYAAAATVTAGADTAVPTQTIVLLQGDGTLTVQSVNDTSPGQNSVRYAGSYSGLGSPPPAGTGSTLLNSIDIGAYGSALVRETTAGQGARNVGFNSASDDRAVVHLAIRELVPRSLPQTVASFTLTGNDATLTKAGGLNNYTLPVDVGAFAFTGRTADLRHNPDLEAGTGTYALTGPPATTRHNVRIEGGTGAFSLTGNDATLAKSAAAKVITADRGSFALTGNPAATRHNPQILGATGTFALNGQPATLRQSYQLTAEVGTFTAAGQPATLRHNPRIEANTGAFALTGGAPALLRGRYLSGGSGTFIETGQPATFRRTWVIRPTAGTFVLTGGTPALTEIGAYEIDPILGTFALAGQPAQLAQSQSLPVDAGVYNLNGRPAATTVGHAITGDLGKFFLPERNLLRRSEEFNDANWNKTNVTATVDQITAPDGSASADLIAGNSGTALKYIVQPVSLSTAGTFTFSVFAKPGTESLIVVRINDQTGTNEVRQRFNLSLGTLVGSVAVAGTATSGTSSISASSNGWYKCVVTATFAAFTEIQGNVWLNNYSSVSVTTNFYLWGAQLEQSSVASDYDPTGPAAATRTDTRHNARITGDRGAFALSGGSAGVAQTYALSADTGTFAATGQPATFVRTRVIAAGRGAFTLTGNPAALTEINAYAIAATTGTFALTGRPAQLRRNHLLAAGRGALTLTGNQAALKTARSITAATGAFALTGNNANLADTDKIFAEPGSFVLTGLSAALVKTSTARRRNVLIF